jgi:hypothetical protein
VNGFKTVNRLEFIAKRVSQGQKLVEARCIKSISCDAEIHNLSPYDGGKVTLADNPIFCAITKFSFLINSLLTWLRA